MKKIKGNRGIANNLDCECEIYIWENRLEFNTFCNVHKDMLLETDRTIFTEGYE